MHDPDKASADTPAGRPRYAALRRLFTGQGAAARVTQLSLRGGETLYSAGELSNTLYFLRAGRLAVIRQEGDVEYQFLGIVRPGEPVGEVALIAGAPHSATVLAMRDCELLAMPRKAFFDAAHRDAALMAELAQLAIVRTRQSAPRTGSSAPATFAFIAVSDTPPIRPMLESIAARIGALGFTATVVGSEAKDAPTGWFSELEDRHDVVIFGAERGEVAWAHACRRQADRRFLVGAGHRAPPHRSPSFAAPAAQDHRLTDLVLVQPKGTRQPCGSAAWMDASGASRLFHVRDGDDADLARMARVLTGTSVGVVFSGGGARAYAHVGVIKALQEAGAPIDFIGGASMGAIIGAGIAAGWSLEETVAGVRRAFVASNPLADVTLPVIAMTRGRLAHERLRASFGDREIEDLWLPFYCVSSNLTKGEVHLHRRGSVRRALEASSALPGILPPVIWGDDVLVDGAVINNLPADIMRRLHRGPVVGVDVAEARALSAKDVEAPKSLWRWFASGEWRKGFPIVSLLMRAATVSSLQEREPLEEACDLLLEPVIEGVELRDWKAFEPAMEAGYQAMKSALENLGGPLIELTRTTRRWGGYPAGWLPSHAADDSPPAASA